ncbi:DUF4388 domain-containing protein [Ktedonospora formicarum]|uniref:PatA-like N-terminal domain-containing protein n=1 Tax=Ktedonospora formicarum TaxID=2778364 RepID=A0A8J3IH12_9CHLR|nr:DUF4388 domain-containing protein [Ktedonospora formicarum]GHO51009.1 hypothetical protein KSX_91720 [Ktedonospora formicarum]
MARGTATDRLSDVIDMLRMAHKTGILSVNRDGAGNVIEQGTIILQNGQIVEASYGPYRGAEALRLLQGWQRCYFSLLPSTHASNPSLPTPQMSPTIRNPTPPPNRGGMESGAAPQRMRAVNEVLPYFERMGLTRLHRQLFLLIDGQRSISELILLIGNRTEEVNRLLDDLRRAGLIRW